MKMIAKYILGSLNLNKFKSENLDQSPLILRNSSQLHLELGTAEVDEYLNYCEGQIDQFVRIVNQQKEVTIPSNGRLSTETQKSFIERSYKSGATIKIEDFECRHPLMSLLCRSLEEEFGGLAYAMTFLTPPNEIGFPVHFDVASAFIVQLEGSKKWRVYEKMVELPTQRMNRHISDSELPSLWKEFILYPGDVLYIPSGFPHSAECTSEHSLHMTIGISPWTSSQVIEYAANVMAEQIPELRERLYSKTTVSADKLKIAIQKLFEKLCDMPAEKLFDAFETSYNANRSDPNNKGLSTFSLACSVDEETIIKKVPGKIVKKYSFDDEILLYPSSILKPGKPLIANPHHIRLPSYAQEEVASIIDSDTSWKVKEIPGALDIASKGILVQELIKHGIVEVVSE
jgi:lysine-specific demethylase/histidyl-hydroxylase NO66